MGWKIWENKNKGCSNLKLLDCSILVRVFYVLSITLLSLLLPLSFLLLARLSSAHYFLSSTSVSPPESLLYSLFLYTNPNILHALVAFVSLSALMNALTSRVGPFNSFPGPVYRPRLYASWMLIGTFQVCVAFGIETTIKAGVNGAGFSEGRSMLSKVVFFVGLYESMIHWARMIARPIVDDTVYGEPQVERWAEKWALTACFGALSWWRLRDEMDALVGVVVVKRDMMKEIGLGDFLGWWLYYVTIVIGVIRIMKGVMWVIVVPFCGRKADEDYAIDLKDGGDEV